MHPAAQQHDPAVEMHLILGIDMLSDVQAACSHLNHGRLHVGTP